MEEPVIKGSNDESKTNTDTDNIDTKTQLNQSQQQQQQHEPQQQQQLTPLQKDVQDILETDLSCAICQDVYINPLILNCSHSFCKFCVFRWLSRKTGCPQCRLLVQFQAENLALRNVIVKLLLKTSPQFQKNRTNSVNQRLKDEEELEKDDRSKIIIPKRSSNLSRAFAQNGGHIAEYVSSMFPPSSSTSGRTPNSGGSDTSEYSFTAQISTPYQMESYHLHTNGYIVRNNRRNDNGDDDYSDDEDEDYDDDAAGDDDDNNVDDDLTDDEDLDNQWLAGARAIITDDDVDDGEEDGDIDDEEHDETYDPNETVDIESLDQSGSESDDDDRFDNPSEDSSFVEMDITDDADASRASIEIDDESDDDDEGSDDDEEDSDDDVVRYNRRPVSPITLCSMEEDSDDSDERNTARHSDTNSDWDDGDRVQYLMSYFQDDYDTSDSSTTIEYGEDTSDSDDF